MCVEGAGGHAGLLGQRIDSNAAETVTAKTATGTGEDLGSTGFFSTRGMRHGNKLHVTNESDLVLDNVTIVMQESPHHDRYTTIATL
jgi:hypothetical protein